MLVKIVTVFGILGIPSIFSMTLYCIRACQQFAKRVQIMEEGIKSSMRSNLIKDYNWHTKNGYISDVELAEWQNQYHAYLQLQGSNGVLEDRYKKLLNLPTEEV